MLKNTSSEKPLDKRQPYFKNPAKIPTWAATKTDLRATVWEGVQKFVIKKSCTHGLEFIIYFVRNVSR
jgi:hypothetical protein